MSRGVLFSAHGSIAYRPAAQRIGIRRPSTQRSAVRLGGRAAPCAKGDPKVGIVSPR
ncbi:hypothetical protein IL992_16410 [Microbispora sp. NEAU-D428]|uniref:hypothetical protein n=1 Tax=Microbispora sitophila TaxID=2771537 RepID=UPI0018673AB0|nr:hypothetical protein [Microbispora sitophila]MBE3010767.1 hypothetical protein [Microbispora sitophila]